MEELIVKFREWEAHTVGCLVCRMFEQTPKVRVVCDEGRAILVQMLTIVEEQARGL